ncbi:MAG: ThiF family adenylyltransferase [Alphaproteobacteria bacterium]
MPPARWQLENNELILVSMIGLTPAHCYARQMILPEIGENGQKKLQQARILLVGAGGLGSPIALYLAASGIGHITMVDGDVVEASNLHRQILYGPADIGEKKVLVAAQKLRAQFPFLHINTAPYHLDVDNAAALVASHDIVVDGTDDLFTRYVLNRACLQLKKPLVYGAVWRFSGQVSVFCVDGQQQEAACLACLFPTPPDEAPNCAEAGVVGVVPGLVAQIQAGEVLKYLLGMGKLLSNRLWQYDLLTAELKMLELARNINCPACGAGASLQWLPAMTQTCSLHEVNWPEWPALQQAGVKLLDVREEEEWEQRRHPDATLYPLSQIQQWVQELPKDQPYLLMCHAGVRSMKAAYYMKEQGFSTLYSLKGGIAAWRG